jgi:PAS domain S-box-containing protein
MTDPQPQMGKATSDSVPIELENAGSPRDEVASLSATLRESEERYRTLFDLSPVAVYSIDAGGVIREFNRHAAELWDRVPVLGDTDQRFCGSYKMFLPDGTYLPRHRCPMATVASGEVADARNAEVVIERPDGTRITVIVNIVPLKNERGEVTGAINCFYDISERSRLELKTKEQAQALADLDRRKDEFLAMLSHELRNPLAPIVNGVQVLKLEKLEDPSQREVLGVIEHQVAQLVHLVDDLMELSRMASGKIVLNPEWIFINDVVERAVEATRPLMLQHLHKLSVALPPEPVRRSRPPGTGGGEPAHERRQIHGGRR